MTLQEIFNKALYGVVQQGVPARGVSGDCKYRAMVDGTLCACGIGHLLPDQDYDPSFDSDTGGTVSGMLAWLDKPYHKPYHRELNVATARRFKDAMARSGVDLDDPEVYSLCESIQGAHDMTSTSTSKAEFVPRFTRRMRLVAEKRNLDCPL